MHLSCETEEIENPAITAFADLENKRKMGIQLILEMGTKLMEIGLRGQADRFRYGNFLTS